MDEKGGAATEQRSWFASLQQHGRRLLLGGLLLALALSAEIVHLSTGRAALPPPDPPPAEVISRDLTLSGPDFAAGRSDGPVSKESGIVLTSPTTAIYTSAVVMAPMPFTDLGALWEANLPPGTSLFLEVRSSPDREGNRWTAWEAIEEEDDLPAMPHGQYAGELYFVPQRDGVHLRLQYRITLAASPSTPLPALHRLTFTFIDARAGPSTHEIISRRPPPQGVSAVEQPPVISRLEWGCPDGEESPNWPQVYEQVTHVIVHHTATPNDDDDWAARVRAIWHYHTYSRGWGDIGYNYVIDPQGNVYEGRAGGDDVVAGHSRGYNFGTMGIGCLGTYSTVPPPTPLQETLEQLIAWKASQRGIDPLGESFNSHKVYDHIAGHRDVGQTACPGDVFYSLLPLVRQNVEDRLLQQEEAVTVDELDPEFIHSDAPWHEGCGRQNHGWWTHTTTDPNISANWGIWRPNLPQGGWYEVFAFVPSCSDGDAPEYTASAHYRIFYRGGGSTVVVNQREEQGRWVSLGVYEFYPGTGGYVYMDDIADDHWHSLWYDTVRWVLRTPSSPTPPAPLLVAPETATWFANREIQLSWSIPPTATVDGVRVVAATDAQLNERIVDQELGVTTDYLLSLDQDGGPFYWSVQSRNANGYGPFAPTRNLSVDTTAPTSSVLALYRTSGGIHILTWGGEDAGSGVASYTVQMRDGAVGEWNDLWTDTSDIAGVVQIPVGVTRYFRVHARDQLGNEEAPHEGNGDLSSEQITPLDWAWNLPLVMNRILLPTDAPISTRTTLPTPSITPTPLPLMTASPTTVPPTPSAIASPTATATATTTRLPTATATSSPAPTAVPGTPTLLPSPTPAGTSTGLPDLRLEAVGSSQDSPFDCDRPSGVAVEISNVGMGSAGTFYLVLEGEGLEDCRWRLEGMAAGERARFVCPVIAIDTVVTATVDIENNVVESDEGNNQLVRPINVLVLPTCTPRPSAP